MNLYRDVTLVIEEGQLTPSTETPLHKEAFAISDEIKIERIRNHFKAIMHIIGLDVTDNSLKDTPYRVAKMYVKEIFSGLNPSNKPIPKLFDNKYEYNEMLIEKDITLYSYCEHHFVPIMGKVHVAYIANGQVIGLSKINRIVKYYARRPQVQERLTNQIAQGLKESLQTEDVAVVVEAIHLCVAARGIEDTNASTITAHYSGRFKEDQTKNELFSLLK